MNITRNTASVLDNRACTEAEFQLREDVFALVEILREAYAEFRNCVIASTAVSVGVREGRHLIGVYTLTGEDLRAGTAFPDSIARSAHPMDVHVSAAGAQILEETSCPGHIPYRAMISPALDNFLATGRILSADDLAHASIRVQGTAMATGQAAGTAAGVCCAIGCTVHALDTDMLCSVLTAHRCLT